MLGKLGFRNFANSVRPFLLDPTRAFPHVHSSKQSTGPIPAGYRHMSYL